MTDIPSTVEIVELIINDPDTLREMFPSQHIEQTTIDIAVDWSNTRCDGCLPQVAKLIRLSLEGLYECCSRGTEES